MNQRGGGETKAKVRGLRMKQYKEEEGRGWRKEGRRKGIVRKEGGRVRKEGDGGRKEGRRRKGRVRKVQGDGGKEELGRSKGMEERKS